MPYLLPEIRRAEKFMREVQRVEAEVERLPLLVLVRREHGVRRWHFVSASIAFA